jgi:hypothetical protein
MMTTGAGVSLITAGVVVRFAIPPGSAHGLNVHAAGIVLMLAGILGLLLSLLWGRLNPAGRHRNSPRSYDSGAPVLVRAEKRLYQGQDRQPPGDHRSAPTAR